MKAVVRNKAFYVERDNLAGSEENISFISRSC